MILRYFLNEISINSYFCFNCGIEKNMLLLFDTLYRMTQQMKTNQSLGNLNKKGCLQEHLKKPTKKQSFYYVGAIFI